MKRLIPVEMKYCVLTALAVFAFASRSAPSPKMVAVASASEPPRCEVPVVADDEACFFSGACYTGLIQCVKAGEAVSIPMAAVHSVVNGKGVAMANTSKCQFYGEDVGYASAEEGCPTDRLWVNAETSLSGD